MFDPRSTFNQVISDLIKVKKSLELATALPKFLRNQVTHQLAEEGLKRLRESRVDRFLEMVRTSIYGSHSSPYKKLLEHAGCEFIDLDADVRNHGLEETLAQLADEGVYLTSDEFKGKTPVVRGKLTFRVSPNDFNRLNSPAGFTMQSSGSSNQPTSTFHTLEWQELRAMTEAVFYATHDFSSGAHAVFEPVLAGRVNRILLHAKLGIATDRWFGLNVNVHSMAEGSYHKLNARIVAKMGKWFGPDIASPEYLNIEDLNPILGWIGEMRDKKTNCRITSVSSTAARIARLAIEKGFSLYGTKFHVSGEPLTQSKRNLIEKSGANVTLHYGPGDGTGGLLGCGNPMFNDEVHLPECLFTLVEHSRQLDKDRPEIQPLIFTTLHPAAPRFLFNVENGDYATLIKRDCNCPLQKIGFTQHIHTIRSFEKLTSDGANYAGIEVFELLEDIIPSEFGGGPGDYQLVEEEDDSGQTRLSLVVHPKLKNIDETKLLSRLRQGLAQGSRNHRFISKVWEDAGAYRIRRSIPRASARGKILPLHIEQKN